MGQQGNRGRGLGSNHVALRNEGASKANGVKNRGQITHFFAL